MKKTKNTLISLGISVAFTSSIHAATITASHDAYVRASSPDTNFNTGSTENRLIVQSTNNQKAWLQFDTSSITGTISDATFSLGLRTIGSSNQTFNVYGLNDGVTGEAWDESTITFNNAPGNAGTFRDVDATETTFLDTITISNSTNSAGDTISFNSANIASYLNNDTNNTVTFIILRDTQGTQGTSFYSTENTGGNPFPTLDITTTTIPEPSTYALSFGLFAVGILAIRRKTKV